MAPGNVAADWFNGRNALADPDSRLGFERPRARDLFFGHDANIFRSSFNSAQKFGTDAPFRGAYFLPGYPNAVAREIQIVQFFRPGEKGGIAAFAHIGDDFGSDGMRFLITPCAAREQPLLDSRHELENAHQSTILFRGIRRSPGPWQPLALAESAAPPLLR